MKNSTNPSSRLKLVLICSLVVVSGLLAYDRSVTRPGFNAAWTRIADMQRLEDGKNGLTKVGDHDGDGFITSEDVSKTAGRLPTATSTIGDYYTVETYSWPRLIPGFPYRAYVIYRDASLSETEQHKVLYAVQTELPSVSDFPAAPEVGEPGSVPNPTVGGLPPADSRPDRQKK